MASRNSWFIVLVGVALAGVACGSNADKSGGSNAATGGGSDLSVTAPSDGANVTQPFTVQVSSSAKIGPTSSGNDHVHLYFDGSQKNYDVCTSTSCQVSGLSPGKHVIEASLRNADHSDAGPKDSITVYVGGGSNGGGNNGGGGTGGGGGGY
jgi:phage baseplate assembly protein gpV